MTVHYEDEVQVKQGLVYALGMVNGQLALLGTGPLENEETEG